MGQDAGGWSWRLACRAKVREARFAGRGARSVAVVTEPGRQRQGADGGQGQQRGTSPARLGDHGAKAAKVECGEKAVFDGETGEHEGEGGRRREVALEGRRGPAHSPVERVFPARPPDTGQRSVKERAVRVISRARIFAPRPTRAQPYHRFRGGRGRARALSATARRVQAVWPMRWGSQPGARRESTGEVVSGVPARASRKRRQWHKMRPGRTAGRGRAVTRRLLHHQRLGPRGGAADAGDGRRPACPVLAAPMARGRALAGRAQDYRNAPSMALPLARVASRLMLAAMVD